MARDALLWVVAREGDEASKSNRQGEEDLCGGIKPHLRILEHIPLEKEGRIRRPRVDTFDSLK